MQMRGDNKKSRYGFNLLETLLASSLLAGTVMTIGALSARSVSTLRIDQETEKAWELADMQLKLIDASGVSAFQKLGQYSGRFAQADNFTWQADIQEMKIPYLFSIDLTVQWQSGSKMRQIRCQTRLCDPPVAEQTETQTLQTQIQETSVQ